MNRIDYHDRLTETEEKVLTDALDALEKVLKKHKRMVGNDHFWAVDNALAQYLVETRKA